MLSNSAHRADTSPVPQSFFGPPAKGFQPGGAHITVYLVPVHDGRLTVFDVEAREARGRWLPWDVLDWGANPYECASALADQWCDVALTDLSLADVMSFPFGNGGWELAIVFRAELAEAARGDADRVPFVFPPGQFDAIGRFDPVDLERWVGASPAVPGEKPPPGPALLF